jgi:hypothetical protein
LVGEPAVRQGREPLQRQGPAGAVFAQPLEADDVILVKPGVGVEREALDEGTAAGRPARGRTRPAPWHPDAFELEDIERSDSDLFLPWTGIASDRRFDEDGGWAFVLVKQRGEWRVRNYGWAVTRLSVE